MRLEMVFKRFVPFLMLWPLAAVAQQVTPMTLREAVRYALEHSPALQSGAAEIQAREGASTTAHSQLLPHVNLFGDINQSRFARAYPPATPPTELRFDETQFRGGAQVGFLLWDFRATKLQLEAARERVQAAGLNLKRREQEVIFQVARLYLRCLTFEDLTKAAQARQKSLVALAERTHALVEGGRAVPADESKVRTRLARIESELAALESGRKSTLSALAAAMGLDGELPRVVYSPPQPAAPSAGEPDQIRQALTARPDLQAVEHEISAAANKEHSVRQSRLPRVSLNAAAIQYASGDPESFANLIGKMLPGLPIPAHTLDNAVADWAVGASVTFPLFDGGQRKGQIQEAAARERQAQLAQQRLRLNIAREVRTAKAELEAAQSRVKSFKEAVQSATEVLHNEQAKYEAGKTVINFVLEAEADLLTNESLLYQAQRSVAIAALSLDLSLGRIRPDIVPGK